jgi:rod shape-determining protein MreD
VVGDVLKAAIAFFVAVVAQAAIVSSFEPGGGTADLVLVTLTAVALLRGSMFGAFAGFYAGFLLDTANLGTLGFSSLLLTLLGYWIGRYGETTGRDRAHAPLLSIAVVTILYQVAALVLRFMLGQNAPAGEIFAALAPTVLLNLALTVPVYALTRRLLRPREWVPREVRLLG